MSLESAIGSDGGDGTIEGNLEIVLRLPFDWFSEGESVFTKEREVSLS